MPISRDGLRSIVAGTSSWIDNNMKETGLDEVKFVFIAWTDSSPVLSTNCHEIGVVGEQLRHSVSAVETDPAAFEFQVAQAVGARH